MNILSRQPVVVLEHETALQVYFDALFQDMSNSIYAEEPEKTYVDEKISEQNNIPEPVIEVVEERVPLTVNEATPAGKVLTWATAPFQSLLFSAHGIKMVVPLIQLHSIVNVTAPIKHVQSDAAWFMGLLPWRGTHVKVIDICRLMAMEGAELKEADENTPKRLVLINDGSWGFLCDEVSEAFTLQPEQIRLRADRTHRAWLAGTVIDYICALLDMDEFSCHISGGTINAC